MSNHILIVEKREGETSFSSLFPIKRHFKKTKVGHAGTLDKFAHGQMIVLVGKFTRLNQLFSKMDKSYLATIKFGEETTTLDPEGEVIKTGPLPTKEEIENILPSFLGTIDQEPPIYSALHVNGKRAYKEARSGNITSMEKRPVTITNISLVSYENGIAVVDTRVSSGTYIRSLARDIANALNTAGHLIALKRYSIGPFDESYYSDLETDNTLRILNQVCKGSINFSSSYLEPFIHGYFSPKGVITISNEEDGYYTVFNEDKFIAVVEKKGSSYKTLAQIL